MKQKTGLFIKEVQEEMEQFSADIKVKALEEFDRIANQEEDLSGGDTMEMSDNMILLMSDPEVLNQHLEQSKENVDSKIGDQETKIVKELATDWKNTETRILEE